MNKVDSPILYVYLAGYMSGEKLEQCLAWRKQIREHYSNWKGAGVPYPIAFLDPFNSGEHKSIDTKGLTSAVPSKAILMGDFMSVQKADVIVANINNFGSDRPMIGTLCEMAWGWQLNKPIITIDEVKTLRNHPFIAEFTTIFVDNAQELLDRKYLNTFYKRISGALYE